MIEKIIRILNQSKLVIIHKIHSKINNYRLHLKRKHINIPNKIRKDHGNIKENLTNEVVHR